MMSTGDARLSATLAELSALKDHHRAVVTERDAARDLVQQEADKATHYRLEVGHTAAAHLPTQLALRYWGRRFMGLLAR